MDGRERIDPSDKGTVTPKDVVIEDEHIALGEQLVDEEEGRRDI